MKESRFFLVHINSLNNLIKIANDEAIYFIKALYDEELIDLLSCGRLIKSDKREGKKTHSKPFIMNHFFINETKYTR